MGFNVNDRVRFHSFGSDGPEVGKGTITEVHADGRLLVIQPDGFLDSPVYKGYEDVEHLPMTNDELVTENARLKDQLSVLKTDYENLRRWYDEAVKKNNELSEQVFDLNQRKNTADGVVVVQVYDDDGDPWQYNSELKKFEMVGGHSMGRKTLQEVAREFKISDVVTLRGE